MLLTGALGTDSNECQLKKTATKLQKHHAYKTSSGVCTSISRVPHTSMHVSRKDLAVAAFPCVLVAGSGEPVDASSSSIPIPPQQLASIQGECRRWHKVTVNIRGPVTYEEADPSPFLQHKLTVSFYHPRTSTSVLVPGYFAADGNAGETGATAGDVWRAHLSPTEVGEWTFNTSFVTGQNIAIDLENVAPGAGVQAAGHGFVGSFEVAETDKRDERDFRGKGMLLPDGNHHLQHENGEYFIKVGTDSPEDMLAYEEFDNTKSKHKFLPHVQDWTVDSPTWQGGKGKGIIGGLNYLASAGLNSVSFLTYNAGGDGNNVWPFNGDQSRFSYDCSKLDQWEILFEHADRIGLHLHFKLQETENDNGSWGLDGGDVGRERILYYRELIARFGHHLALNWNLGEENRQSTAQRIAMADVFQKLDPYHHNLVLHTYPHEHGTVYTPLLGPASPIRG